MRELIDQEIDYILDDLRENGIHDEELRQSLLDHICAIFENECPEDANFEEEYLKIRSRFYTDALSEIQKETNNLMRFKHFYAMKKTLKIAGFATALFTVLGAILKTFHLPGAGVCIVLGGFFLSFIFLPLLIIMKFRDDDTSTDKAVFTFGFIIAMTLSVGLIFKLMHWPGANILMLGSTVIFTFVYVPIYFITRFNRPEVRFNTIVNSVLMFACGGIFFSLFDLSYSHNFSKQMSQNHLFIHDNSNRIFDSNKRLAAAKWQSQTARELHEASNEINDQLEEVAANILEANTTKIMEGRLEELKSGIQSYNRMLEEINSNELKRLDADGLEVMHRLSIQLALNNLARIQQQMAVNDNCFLTTRVDDNINQLGGI